MQMVLPFSMGIFRHRVSLPRFLMGLAWLFWAFSMNTAKYPDANLPGWLEFLLYWIPATLAPIVLALGVARAQRDPKPWAGVGLFLAAVLLLLHQSWFAKVGFEEMQRVRGNLVANPETTTPMLNFAGSLAQPLSEEELLAGEASDWTRRDAAAWIYQTYGVNLWWRGWDGEVHEFHPTAEDETSWQSKKEQILETERVTERMNEIADTTSLAAFIQFAYTFGWIALTVLGLAWHSWHRNRVKGLREVSDWGIVARFAPPGLA